MARSARRTADNADNLYRITFDGGSRGNPGEGYGSYQILLGGGGSILRHLDFGPDLTNNQAEYMALVAALQEAQRLAERSPQGVRKTHLIVCGDSKLVTSQLSGEWKVRAEHLRPLYQQALSLLQAFAGHRLEHVPREVIVPILGH